jgi:hypothetical protein
MAIQITAAIAHRMRIDGHGEGAPGRMGSCPRLEFPDTRCATIR